MNHIEGLLAVKPNEERSGDAVAEPAEEKDLAEAQEAEDGCGKSWDGTFSEGDPVQMLFHPHHLNAIVVYARSVCLLPFFYHQFLNFRRHNDDDYADADQGALEVDDAAEDPNAAAPEKKPDEPAGQ